MNSTSPEAVLAKGQDVLKREAVSLQNAADRLGSSFVEAVSFIAASPGKVICCGLGKSGHVARKIAATLASTGTPAFFLHPAEALHGDLGMISDKDCLLAIAYGGETAEVLEVCKYAKRVGITSIALTGKGNSTLASLADIVLDGSITEEACPHNLAPTSSSTLAMALGDALAVALMEVRGFSVSDFAAYHPAGSLGRRLAKVTDVMRPRQELTTINADDSFASILDGITKTNFGIVAVVDERDRVLGVITDGDLRRALSSFNEGALRKTAGELMSTNPKLVRPNVLAVEAFSMMEKFKITSLLVAEAADRASPLLGLIRMHDLLEQKII